MYQLASYFKAYSVFTNLRKSHPLMSLLESLGDHGEDIGRFSIVGVLPDSWVWEKKGLYFQQQGFESLPTILPSADKSEDPPWLTWLADQCPLAGIDGLQTGVMGYINYDVGLSFENLSSRHSLCSDFSLFLVSYSLVFIEDIKLNKRWWVAKNIESLKYAEALEKENDTFDGLNCVNNQGNLLISPLLKNCIDKESFSAIIDKTIEYIKNGDIFQANITFEFLANYNGDLFLLYEQLRYTNPNPFFAFLDFPHKVISSSPERFFKIAGNRIVSQPIKGSIRALINGRDQGSTLKNSLKDQAENTMITDLVRNDIGRIAQLHSVQVDALHHVRKFNHLYHLESVITGVLKKNSCLVDVFKALFPAGSITGAPKIRAMEIIDELEWGARNTYCGTIGFFGHQGYVDTNVAIRTLYADNSLLHFHSGGGITIASEPDSEWEELKLKTEGIQEALSFFSGQKEKV